MSKLISCFVIWFIGGAMLSASLQGGGGITSTALTSGITKTDTTFNVTTTNGFLDADFLYLSKGEKVSYFGKTATSFTGVTRGLDSTEALAYQSGTIVSTESSQILSDMLGFSPSAVATTTGNAFGSVITVGWSFFSRGLPHLVMLNFNFLTGDLAIVGVVFWALGVGLLIAFAQAFKPNIL